MDALRARLRARDFAAYVGGDLRATVGQSLLRVSGYLPGTVQKTLLNAAGAHVQSPLGFGFRFTGQPSNLTIGPEVYFNNDVYVDGGGPVDIGSGCALAMGVMIVTSTHDVGPAGAWSTQESVRGVRIGERVWVGARAVILPGVRIAAESIIAAGAVVTRDCDVPGLYAGVPARWIRAVAPAEASNPAQRD